MSSDSRRRGQFDKPGARDPGLSVLVTIEPHEAPPSLRNRRSGRLANLASDENLGGRPLASRERLAGERARLGRALPYPPGDGDPSEQAAHAQFLVSESADFAVYTPLEERGWLAAVVASNVVGTIVDSALVLWLAFGSLTFLKGQVVGKLWMTAIAASEVLGSPRSEETTDRN